MENNKPLGIKRASEFLELKHSGKRYWPTKWLLLNYQKNELGTIRFGITASRKVGSAVVRNKLKRWCREAIRAFSIDEGSIGVDVNIIFRPMDSDFYKGLSHDEFIKDFKRGLASLRKNC